MTTDPVDALSAEPADATQTGHTYECLDAFLRAMGSFTGAGQYYALGRLHHRYCWHAQQRILLLRYDAREEVVRQSPDSLQQLELAQRIDANRPNGGRF